MLKWRSADTLLNAACKWAHCWWLETNIDLHHHEDTTYKHINGSVKELNMFHNYETEKITRKDRDAAENLQLYQVVQFPPEIVMHDTFNAILWTSADICVVVHDDLGWKNRTTQYNCRFSDSSLALRVIFVRRKRTPIYASCIMISGRRTEHDIIGFAFAELAAVD